MVLEKTLESPLDSKKIKNVNPKWEDLLEKEMATHSSILAWKIPWTEKPGGLQSKGSQSWTQLND